MANETTLTAEELKAIGNKFYFMVFDAEDDEDKAVGIVYKDFWKENEVLDDCWSGDDTLESVLPAGFHNSSESEWQFSSRFGTFAQGIQMLLDAGFEQIENPWK